MSKFTIRECWICKKDYEHFACNRSGVCRGCRNEYYKHRRSEEKALGKNPLYPLGIAEQRKRYRGLQSELSKCNTKEERKEFYDKVIKEMYDTGIWDWCVSKTTKGIKPKHEDDEGNPLPGRIPNEAKEIPNTKDMPY